MNCGQVLCNHSTPCAEQWTAKIERSLETARRNETHARSDFFAHCQGESASGGRGGRKYAEKDKFSARYSGECQCCSDRRRSRSRRDSQSRGKRVRDEKRPGVGDDR